MSMGLPIDSNAASTMQRVDAAACLGVVVLVHVAVLAMLPAGRGPLPGIVRPVTVTLLAPPEPPAAAGEALVVPVEKPRRVAPKAAVKPLVPDAPTPPAALPSSALPAEVLAPAAEIEHGPASSTSAPPEKPAPPAAASAPGRASDRTEAPPLVPPQYDAAYLDNPKPEYPRLARRLGEQGKVLLNVYVGTDGRPEKVELHTSSGSPRLDQAARTTVARWKFVPARQGERPVGAWLVVPITFVLES